MSPKLALAILILIPAAARAQFVVTPSPLVERPGGLGIDAQVRRTLAGAQEARIEGFILDGQPRTLVVTRFEVFAPDAAVVTGTRAGDQPLPRPDVQLWRGRITDLPDSRVYLALGTDSASGYVIDRDHTWIVSGGPVASPIRIVTFDSLAAQGVKTQPAVCDGIVDVPGAPPVVMNFGNSTRSWTCRTIRIAIDCDYEFTQNLFGGNSAGSAAYIVALFGAISEIYQRDTNIIIEVGYLRTWTTSEDPYSSPNTSEQLPQFQNYWNQNMGSVQRNIAHLCSGRSLGGGIAYGNVACHPTYGYAVSSHLNGFFPYPLQNHNSQNWDVMVCAHEMGHNLGTRHSHDPAQYNPPIDGCGANYLSPPQPQDCSQSWNGTIMSYCHLCPGGITNINLTFGSRVSTAIRAYLDTAAASCGTVPTFSLTQQPQPLVVSPGSTAQFSVAASGPAQITYQWRKNQVALGSSSHVIGTQTSQLTIMNVQPADAASYDVVVTNVCGTETSQPAALTVQSSCYPNCDNSTGSPTLTANDFQCFIDAFAASQPYANCDNSTGSPLLTSNDFQCFINRFAAGCP